MWHGLDLQTLQSHLGHAGDIFAYRPLPAPHADDPTLSWLLNVTQLQKHLLGNADVSTSETPNINPFLCVPLNETDSKWASKDEWKLTATNLKY